LSETSFRKDRGKKLTEKSDSFGNGVDCDSITFEDIHFALLVTSDESSRFLHTTMSQLSGHFKGTLP
jgi:hypothetical protein